MGLELSRADLHQRAYLSHLAQYPEWDLGWEEPQEGERPAPNRVLR